MKRILGGLSVILVLVACRTYLDNQRIVELKQSVTQRDLEANVLIWSREDTLEPSDLITLGSGAIIHREGNTYYVLSAYHVVEGSDNFNFYYYDYYDGFLDFDMFEAGSSLMEVVDYDAKRDLVLLRFESKDVLNVFSIANQKGRRIDPVLVISNPKGEYNVVSTGRIKSDREQEIAYEDGTVQSNLMVHSADIKPGSSGSAVLNQEHELIGINIASNLVRFSISDTPINVSGYFVPLDHVNAFLNDTEIRKRID